MNHSKIRDPRFRLRWRLSGAISDRVLGFATTKGIQTCPCAGWARRVDANFRKACMGTVELKHHSGCDGTGKYRHGRG